MSRTVVSLVFVVVIFSWMTSVWTSPVLQQVCYRVDDPGAMSLSRVYRPKDKLLLERSSNDELLNCSSVPCPVELDKCSACVAEKLLIVKCNLTDPSAKLDLEGEGMMVPLNYTKIPCDSITAASITARDPPTTTAHPPTTSANLSGGPITGIVFAVLFVFAVVVAVAAAVLKKNEIRSWWKRRYQPGQKEDLENVANGHLPGQ